MDSGLMAYWSFDEGSGDTAYDYSGNGNYGTIYGAAWINGVSGDALHFDGEDDHVSIPNAPTLNFGNGDFSITVWIKTDNSKNDHLQIVEKEDRTGAAPFKGYHIRVTMDTGHENRFEACMSDGSIHPEA